MDSESLKKKLLELRDLQELGLLSEEEFQREKAALLAQFRQVGGSGSSSSVGASVQSSEGADFYGTGGAVPSAPAPSASVDRDAYRVSSVMEGADAFVTGGGAPSVAESDFARRSSFAGASGVGGVSEVGGQVLLGRYRLGPLLGQGGMGAVYLCHDQVVGREYALKLIHPHLAQDPALRQRFVQELAVTERLTHPGIVRSYALLEDPRTNTYFTTMEYVEGQTLEALLVQAAQEGAVPLLALKRLLELLKELAEILDYAHRMGVVHRDLKPANVMILPDGRAKVMDFGIAKVVGEGREVQHTGYTGTVYYMAPEQLRGGGAVMPAADVFSLAVIVYQILTGELPMGALRRPSEVNPALPAQLDAVLFRAMSADAGQRYQGVQEFVGDFAAVLEASPHLLRHSAVSAQAGYALVQPGAFAMGSPLDDQQGQQSERPVHEVTLTQGFFLKSTPVTQAEWSAVMGYNPSFFQGDDGLPVESVSWVEAIAYCNALSLQEGLPVAYQIGAQSGQPGEESFKLEHVTWLRQSPGFRLPTEAEWEYACRAGSRESRYGAIGDIAWFRNNSGGKPQRVAQKMPNAWGLYDMLGNVWEWVFDAWGDYEALASADPVHSCESAEVSILFPADGLPVRRGGSFGYFAEFCRAACRNCDAPDSRTNFVGFRVCRTLT